jgi:hypothetical protein
MHSYEHSDEILAPLDFNIFLAEFQSFCQGSRVVFRLWFWIVILTDGFYGWIGLEIVSSDPKTSNANTAA